MQSTINQLAVHVMNTFKLEKVEITSVNYAGWGYQLRRYY